jgi:hypothetical protein
MIKHQQQLHETHGVRTKKVLPAKKRRLAKELTEDQGVKKERKDSSR